MAKQLNNPQASTVYPVTEEWLVESEAELLEIPESAPFGSRAWVLIKDDDELTENNLPKGKLTLKIKDSAGNWVEVFGGD